MAILNFLLHLASAIMLLLFAVRMVRTGIERSFGASFQRLLTSQRNLIGASTTGLGLAVVLQSSAAVTLLVAGFTASGLVGFGSGLAVVLGGDLGSALVIQVLSFRLDWLVPMLLAVGGWLFLKSDQRRLRQYGRILIGIAFILISLRFLREAMEPIRESAFLPAIAGYLARDYLTAFIVGAVLAFVMHSSVATVLMCVTLVAMEAIPLEAGISLVLGANLGSALIPIWLTRDLSPAARRVPIANLALRGSWALITLFAVNLLPIPLYLTTMESAQTLVNTHTAFNLPTLPQYLTAIDAGQTLVNIHIAFNLMLLILSLPFARPIARIAEQLMPARQAVASHPPPEVPHSALDLAVLGTPRLALSSLKRELLRMAELVERMARPVMDVYESGDLARIEELRRLDSQVNDALSGTRSYVAALPTSDMTERDTNAAREMAEYAISLETAGDTIAKRILPLAQEKAKKELRFSPEGWSELLSMHESVMANMRLASNVLVSDDLESARLLIEEKTEIARLERTSRRRHLKRLAAGESISFETSDIHLETLRGLKDFNSQISAVAYPILYRNGQLLETRLIETMDERKNAS